MYLIASLFQNNMGDYKRKYFDNIINCIFFLALLVSVKTKVIINKIIAGFHDLLFASVKTNGVLFFILTMMMIVFIETNVNNGSVDNFLNLLLRDFKKDEENKSNIIEYFVKLIYSIFGGFVTFLHLTKYLIFPLIFIVMITIWTVKTPVKMMWTRALYFFAASSLTSVVSLIMLFPQTAMGLIKKEFISLSKNNTLTQIKNLKTDTWWEIISSIISFIFILLGSLIYLIVGTTSILSYLPLLFVGFTTILSLSYDLSLGFIFNEGVRKLILLLFQRFSQLIKIIFMIFAVDLIYKVLGKNALYISLTLFIAFFGFDYFQNSDSKSPDSDNKKNNILGDLDDMKDFMPFQKA